MLPHEIVRNLGFHTNFALDSMVHTLEQHLPAAGQQMRGNVDHYQDELNSLFSLLDDQALRGLGPVQQIRLATDENAKEGINFYTLAKETVKEPFRRVELVPFLESYLAGELLSRKNFIVFEPEFNQVDSLFPTFFHDEQRWRKILAEPDAALYNPDGFYHEAGSKVLVINQGWHRLLVKFGHSDLSYYHSERQVRLSVMTYVWTEDTWVEHGNFDFLDHDLIFESLRALLRKLDIREIQAPTMEEMATFFKERVDTSQPCLTTNTKGEEEESNFYSAQVIDVKAGDYVANFYIYRDDPLLDHTPPFAIQIPFVTEHYHEWGYGERTRTKVWEDVPKTIQRELFERAKVKFEEGQKEVKEEE